VLQLATGDKLKVFIYEYISAEASGPATPPSLRREGRAMLEAAVADFAAIPGVRVQTLLNNESVISPNVAEVVRCDRVEEAFLELARRNDFTLVIAPEFDDLLKTRSRWVLESGGRLLGCSPEAIRLTGDKLALAAHWRQHDVPTPRTEPYECDAPPPFPAICKPRFGAGSQATFRASNNAEFTTQLVRNPWPGPRIVQPFVSGKPASVALIVGRGERVALLPASQQLSNDGLFQYQGGVLPLPHDWADRAIRLAKRAVAPVSALCGYVGVDLVLGDAPDGGDDVAIEINPRLTTSYVGLRALAASNLAGAMLAAARGEPLPSIPWRAGRIRFDAQGQVHPAS
jgi:predicted ATP-grasp superfamily ATP-dependent carboligase